MRLNFIRSLRVFIFVFSSLLLFGDEINSQSKYPVLITVNSTDVTGPAEHIWNGIGGSLGLALTPEGEQLLERITGASPYPYYRRCWGITQTGTAVPFALEIVPE